METRRRVRKPTSRNPAPAGEGGWSAPRLVLLIVGVILAIIILAHLAMAALASPTVAVVEAKREPLVRTVVATGRVEAPDPVSIGALMRGNVRAAWAREGDTVRAGQVILTLHDEEASATRRVAAAELAQMRAQLARVEQYEAPLAVRQVERATLDLENARADHARAQALADAGAISRQEMERANQRLAAAREAYEAAVLRARATQGGGSEIAVARAAVAAAEAGLASTETRLGYTRIMAPTDGVVLERRAEPGDAIGPGDVLLVLSPLGETRLLVQLDERALALVQRGQPAVASADALPDRPFPAVVEWIAPAVDRDRGTIGVRLRVPDPPKFLRPDMTVSVTIEARRSTAGIAVPGRAVVQGERGPAVLVVRDGQVERIPVAIGLRGSGHVEVVGPLRESEVVIVPDGDPPTEGSRVQTRPWTAEQEAPRSGSGIPFH